MNTTYGPRPVRSTDDVFEWSDLGGNYLNLRRLDNGELIISARGVSAFGGTERETVTFAIASIDVAEFLAGLDLWINAR